MSMDFVYLESIADGLVIHGGYSTNPGLPAVPWAALNLRDVNTVMLDLSENDELVFQVGSDIYAPNPNDVVFVLPNALSVPGIDTVGIATGLGQNTVLDYTLASASPANAQLLVNGGIFSPVEERTTSSTAAAICWMSSARRERRWQPCTMPVAR